MKKLVLNTLFHQHQVTKQMLLWSMTWCFVSNLSIAQSEAEARTALEALKNVSQIDSLQRAHPTWIIYSDKTVETDSLENPDAWNAPLGSIVWKKLPNYAKPEMLKVLAEGEEELVRVQYIFLNGAKLQKAKIDEMRKVILKRYANGTSFDDLVKEYTMDGNKTGDLGWFYKGMMVEEFDTAVRNRKKGEVFLVDVKENNWYYVVLKTHDNLKVKSKIGLKIFVRS